MANPEWGADVLKKVWPMLEDVATIEKDIQQEGRYMSMYVVPNKK